MVPLLAATQPHIPAWKKLGLKLKYAKDDPAPPPESTPTPTTANEKKRKHSSDSHTGQSTLTSDLTATKSSKKLKVTNPQRSIAPTTHNGDIANEVPVPESSASPDAERSKQSPPTSTPTPTKRKSVTFTPETKASDGQSSKDLYVHWLATQKAEDPSFNPSQAQPALHPINPAQSTLSPRPDPSQQESVPPKKSKKPKSKKTAPASEASGDSKIHPALAYLSHFSTTPHTWKFSKNHQTHLLKHVFDLSAIPPSYSSALRTYLAGLKGESARQRVRETALKVREEEEMWFSDLLAKESGEREKKKRREEYEAAWRNEKERLKEIEEQRRKKDREGPMLVVKGVAMSEWERRVKKRKRAEDAMWAVGEEAPVPAVSAAGEASSTGMTGVNARTKAAVNGGVGLGREPNGNTTANGKRKRVRKRRTTGVPDDDESSSSSSSSDDSSSDEEGKSNGQGNVKTPPDSKMDPDSPSKSRSKSETSSSESDSDSSSGSDDSD